MDGAAATTGSGQVFTSAGTPADGEANADYPARPVWQPDSASDSCTGCQVKFSSWIRRHHCRGCGALQCSRNVSCLGGQFMLLPKKFGYTIPQRVCASCRALYAPIDVSVNRDEFGPRESTGIVLIHPEMHSRQFWALVAPMLGGVVSGEDKLSGDKQPSDDSSSSSIGADASNAEGDAESTSWSSSNLQQAQHFNYTVYCPDLPLHGSLARTREDIPLTLDSAATCVEEAAKEHGRAVVVVGFGGLGGMVATRFADTHPSLCAGLVLVQSSIERFGKLEALKLHSQQISYAATPTSMQWSILPELHKSLSPDAVATCFLRSTVDYNVFPKCFPLLLEPSQHWLRDAIHAYDGPILFIETDRSAQDRHVEGDNDSAQFEAVSVDGTAAASLGTSAKFKHALKSFTKRKDRGGHVLIDAARRGTLHIIEGDYYCCVADFAQRHEFVRVIGDFISKQVGAV